MGRMSSITRESVDRKRLLWFVSELCKTAKKNASMPALKCILVESRADGLRLTATDLEVHALCDTGWVLTDEFTALVNAHRLKTLLESDGDEVALSFIPEDSGFGKLAVTVGGVTARLPSIDPADYSPEPEMKDAAPVATFEPKEFIDALAFVMNAVNPEDTRYNMMGVHLNGKTGRLESTDGQRAHIAKVDGIAGDIDMTLPIAAASALHRIAKRYSDTVVVGCHDKNGVYVSVGDWRIFTRRIDGQFPPLNRVDVKDSSLDVFAVGDGKKLTKGLRQAKKLAHIVKGAPGGMLTVHPPGQGAIMKVGDPADGDKTEIELPLEAEKWDDTDLPVTVALNVAYLLQAVSASNDTVRIGLTRATKVESREDARKAESFAMVKTDEADFGPIVITPRSGWRVLLMPMRM